MAFREGCADFGVFLEVWRVGDSWEFALQVGGVAGAILRVVEQGVVEDVPLGDGLRAVYGLVGDIDTYYMGGWLNVSKSTVSSSPARISRME